MKTFMTKIIPLQLGSNWMAMPMVLLFPIKACECWSAKHSQHPQWIATQRDGKITKAVQMIIMNVFLLQKKTFENKLEEGQVFVEFEHIPKKAGKGESTVATSPENKHRNRFKDVYPYDHNRVKLTPRKDNKHGYINASHLKVRKHNCKMWELLGCVHWKDIC